MTHPNCYNRPPFKDTVQVQDGWASYAPAFGFVTQLRKMKTIPDPMSKGCQQHGPLGQATLHGWDCEGCRWKPTHTV